MIVICPSCATRFTLDESRLGGRPRRVRCSRCRHEWVETPPGPDEAPPAAPPAQPESPPTRPEAAPPAMEPGFIAAAAAGSETLSGTLPPEPPLTADRPDLREVLPPPLSADDPLMAPEPEGGRGVALGWIVLLLVIASAAVALYVARERVMEIWPPSTQAYEMVGLASLPAGAGLAIQDVKTATATPDGGGLSVLTVKGRITNVSRTARRVPPLRATLRDPAGQEVRGWNFSVARQMLSPGESVDFETRLEAPPSDALNVAIIFTPPPR